MFGRTLEQTGAAVVRSSAAVNQSPPPKIRSWAYCVTSTTMGLLGSKPMIRSAKTAELLRLPRLIGGGDWASQARQSKPPLSPDKSKFKMHIVLPGCAPLSSPLLPSLLSS